MVDELKILTALRDELFKYISHNSHKKKSCHSLKYECIRVNT